MNQNPENNNLLEGLVSHDWVGGQQFMLTNKDALFSPSNKYKVTILATDDGVLNIEGRTSKTLVPLTDYLIKFENLKPEQKTCYKYDIPEGYKNENLILKMSVIKGNAKLLLSPSSIPKKNDDFPIQFDVLDKTTNYELPHSTRLKLNAESGVWLICIESKKITSFYTLQVFLSGFSDKNKTFQKNLESLLNKDNTYNLEDHKLLKNRLLLQDTAILTPSNKTVVKNSIVLPKSSVKGISINGTGVAGIATFIIFLITVLIGITCIDNIFVSTKFVEHPLLLGKVEY